jgi:hypothetical protein
VIIPQSANHTIPVASLLPTSTNESAVESKNDELLLTTDEEEQIEHVKNASAQILEDLNDLQFEQQQELDKEQEEVNLIREEVDEVSSKKSSFFYESISKLFSIVTKKGVSVAQISCSY